MGQSTSSVISAIFDELRSSPHAVTPEILAKRISEKQLTLSPSDIAYIGSLMRRFTPGYAINYVPDLLFPVVSALSTDNRAKIICDPWAGFGTLLASVKNSTSAATAIAIVQNPADRLLGETLAGSLDWELGDPLDLLSSRVPVLDLVVSIPPFGARTNRALSLEGIDGKTIDLRDDSGNLIVAASADRLSPDGVGIYVIPSSFFTSSRSVLRQFTQLGLSVAAALALPLGAFAPYTQIQTYLIVVKKHPTKRMFVGLLSGDTKTNLQVVSNFRAGKEGGPLELGRLIDPEGFTGLESIRMTERLQQAKRTFGSPALRLEELALAVTLGRYGEDFSFPSRDNALYVPLIGNSDVVASKDDMSLKPQNYAQVAIDPTRSSARFVAQFLNSELGRELREGNKTGTVIPKLNTQGLKAIPVFLPNLQTQTAVLEIETQVATERNVLSSLQNELIQFQRELWSNPQAAPSVRKRLSVLSGRMSGSLKHHAASELSQWIESLPFPLASILRAWQTTQSKDFKTQYEHLLHFFEATTEFFSVILLSAFASNETLFMPHKRKLSEAMRKPHLSFERATFGTWKLVVEYLGKQTRELLNVNRPLCAEIFSDASLELPAGLSRIELGALLSSTIMMRNDWSGHGGVVGQDEARLRNEHLISKLQELRNILADTWASAQLIRATHTVHRRGVFDNEVMVLEGSNSEFLKESRSMAVSMDVERLYLSSRQSSQALKLLPLIQIGPSPQSAKNACYFFSRLEANGARFVSYHYADKPELTGQFDDAAQTIKFLSEDQE